MTACEHSTEPRRLVVLCRTSCLLPVAPCRKLLTTLLWAGFVPAALAGGAAAWWRTRFYAVTVRNKFRCAGCRARALGQLHGTWLRR